MLLFQWAIVSLPSAFVSSLWQTVTYRQSKTILPIISIVVRLWLYIQALCVCHQFTIMLLWQPTLLRVFFLQQEAITWCRNREELWQVDYIKNMFEIPFLVCTPQMCIYVHTKSESEIYEEKSSKEMNVEMHVKWKSVSDVPKSNDSGICTSALMS